MKTKEALSKLIREKFEALSTKKLKMVLQSIKRAKAKKMKKGSNALSV